LKLNEGGLLSWMSPGAPKIFLTKTNANDYFYENTIL
jgi:hypothetical protein